ncbi:MAG: hypothetical protein LUM44_23650 [Pyrinomonadaceae bacterium]|nr:hypothetical protein [Pyrinomonadaceae bacterium]
MKMTVKYWDGKRNYGSGENSTKYSVSVSNPYKDEIKIEFNFTSIPKGKNTNHNNQSYIQNGEIQLPKRQALALASAIISTYQALDSNDSALPVNLEMNEYDLIYWIEEGTTYYRFAELIKAKDSDVLEELEKEMNNQQRPNNYHSLEKLINYIKPSLFNKKNESRSEIYTKVSQIVEEIKSEILKNSYIPLRIAKNIQNKLKVNEIEINQKK